jgi:methylated-DNA-[protein]-cysteine S-methyltransferase
MTQGADPDRAEAHFHLFDTAIGPCGLAWTSAGLIQVQLPEASEAATEMRLGRITRAAWSDKLPDNVSVCEDRMHAYFEGEPVAFTDIDLDMSRVNAFSAKVYTALRGVGWGETTSYGALARQIGDPHAARAIGAAMGKNPWPLVVPCHRVLAASGKIGGFSAYGGRATKRKMLQLEQADADGAAPTLPGLFD